MSVKRHIFHTLVTRILLTVIMVIQSVFVTRLMGAEGRGLYAKLQAGLNFFILFLGFGLSAGIVHYIANRKFSSEKIMGVSLWLWLSNVTLLGIFLMLFRWFPSNDLIFPAGYQLPFYQCYFFLSFALTSFQIFLNAALGGRQRFPLINTFELIVNVLRVLIFAAFFIAPQFGFKVPNLETIFVADLSLTFFKTGIYIWGYLREFGPRVSLFRGLREVVFSIMGFSLLVYFSFLLSFFYLRLDYWLIEWKLGLKELGIYSVAASLAQFITFIPMTLNSIMLPHLSASDPAQMMNQFKKFSRLNVMACGALTLFFLIFGSPLIAILYGASFAATALPLRLLAIAFFFLSVKHLFAFYNIVQRRTRQNIWAEVLGLLVGVSLNLILIPRLGTAGAAIAAVVANFVSLIYLTTGIFWKWPVHRSDFFIFNSADLKSIYLTFFPVQNEDPL